MRRSPSGRALVVDTRNALKAYRARRGRRSSPSRGRPWASLSSPAAPDSSARISSTALSSAGPERPGPRQPLHRLAAQPAAGRRAAPSAERPAGARPGRRLELMIGDVRDERAGAQGDAARRLRVPPGRAARRVAGAPPPGGDARRQRPGHAQRAPGRDRGGRAAGGVRLLRVGVRHRRRRAGRARTCPAAPRLAVRRLQARRRDLLPGVSARLRHARDGAPAVLQRVRAAAERRVEGALVPDAHRDSCAGPPAGRRRRRPHRPGPDLRGRRRRRHARRRARARGGRAGDQRRVRAARHRRSRCSDILNRLLRTDVVPRQVRAAAPEYHAAPRARTPRSPSALLGCAPRVSLVAGLARAVQCRGRRGRSPGGDRLARRALDRGEPGPREERADL